MIRRARARHYERRQARQKVEMRMETVTIGGSNLSLHCGANRVSLKQLQEVRLPAATASYTPIPHDFIVNRVRDGLADLGFEITEEAHALWGDGNRYFGLMGLRERVGFHPQASNDLTAGRQFVFGLRNSHDKSFPASGVLGTRVFVCDNLAMSGAEFKFARKHTRWALRDIPGIISDRLAGLIHAMRDVEKREAAYAAYRFDDEYQQIGARRGTMLNDCMMRLLRCGAISTQSIQHIIHEFERADAPGGHVAAGAEWENPTMWRLQQAITEVDKSRPGLLNIAKRHTKMNAVCDAVVAHQLHD